MNINIIQTNKIRYNRGPNEKLQFQYRLQLGHLIHESPAVSENRSDFSCFFDIGPADINLLLNNNVVIQVLEVLPKEKTNQLAQFELSLAPLFKLHDGIARPRTGTTGADASIGQSPVNPGGIVKEESKRYLLDRLRTTLQSGLVQQQTAATSAQVNAASAIGGGSAVANSATNATAAATTTIGAAGTTSTAVTSIPTMDIEVSLKKTLVSAEEFEDGNIVTISLKEMVNLPEEWSAVDGTERDINSNMYNYGIVLHLPAAAGGSKTIALPYGTLIANKAAQTRMVTWDRSFTAYFSPSSLMIIRERILSKKPALFLELKRQFLPKFAHLEKDNEIVKKYSAFAPLDLAQLYFPKIVSANISTHLYSIPSEIPSVNFATLASLYDTRAFEHSSPQVHDVYATIGTSISVILQLDKTLLGRKRLATLTNNVGDYIKKRDVSDNAKKNARGKKAIEAYRSQIRDLTRGLVYEFQNVPLHLRGQMNIHNDAKTEDVKENFLRYLESKGYHSTIKETMKRAVTQVIQEYFDKKSAFATKEELQVFMSEVYVLLQDLLHMELDKMFSEGPIGLDSPQQQKFNEMELLYYSAIDAESENEFEISRKYLLERIALDQDSAVAWADYAFFCLRQNERDKGIECLKEALSRDEKHIPSLLALACTSCDTDQFDGANSFFNTALSIQPRDPLTHALYGLFFEVIDDTPQSDKYLESAKKYLERLQPGASIFSLAAEFLLNLNLNRLAEYAFAEEILLSKEKTETIIMLARLEYQQGNVDNALKRLTDLAKDRSDESNIWASIGHYRYIMRQYDEAKLAYEKCLNLDKSPKNPVLAQRRLATICLKLSEVAESSDNRQTLLRQSKSLYLQSCHQQQSVRSWLGVGQACYHLEEYADAEDALTEANAINPKDGDVWAMIAVLCVRLGRSEEAHLAISQARHLQVSQGHIVEILGELFAAANENNFANECFKWATKIPGFVPSKRTKQLAEKINNQSPQKQTKSGKGQQQSNLTKNTITARQIVQGAVSAFD